MGATDRTDGPPGSIREQAEQPPAAEPEQGPRDDDPTNGLLDDESLTVADRSLVEPGLSEAELGLLELGDVPEGGRPALDEFGTPDGDEADAAAEELDEDAGLVAGSEPADVPGATDDLFPAEEPGGDVRDAGEEGFDEDLGDALDDSVRTGDAAWRQSGPPDEGDDLGGELPFTPAGPARLLRAVSRIVEVRRSEPVLSLVGCGDRLVVLGRAPGSDVVQLEIVRPALHQGPLGPPLRFADEEQRVVAVGLTRESATGAVQVVHAATDRAMVFRWVAGTAEWTVVDGFTAADGTTSSWLPLGVSRMPFHLEVPTVDPGRAWAWRPGGPLLQAVGPGPWTVRDEGRILRAVAEDAPRGELLAFFAADETARMESWGAAGRGGERSLPPSVADVLLAPNAAVAARDGVLWVFCLDPELATLRSSDGGRTWTSLPGLRSVRALVLAPGPSCALAVRRSNADETDEVWRVAGNEAPRLVLRASDLCGPGAGHAEPAGRVDGFAVLAGAPGRAWVVCGGRLFEVELEEAFEGRRA
jgi:hypothetical protein